MKKLLVPIVLALAMAFVASPAAATVDPSEPVLDPANITWENITWDGISFDNITWE